MINVVTNHSDLRVNIRVPDNEEVLLRNLVSLFSSPTNFLPIVRNSISIPWADFQINASDFVLSCREANQKVVFDEFSKSLIVRLLDVNKYYKERIPYFDLSEKEIPGILEQYQFNRVLTNSQLRDIRTLINLRHGANFSVPGAGKTTTLLAVFTLLRHYSQVNKLFVISPKNAFISWEEEIETIFGNLNQPHRLKEITYSSVKSAFSEHDVVLVNYEEFRKETNTFVPFFLKQKIHFVLDEAHRIKSGTENLSFAQIDRLADICSRRDILSGTPLPQSYDDLRPQFYFLWRKDILPLLGDGTKEDTSIAVNNSIKNLFVRTTKDELGLPDPIFHYLPIKMGPIQNEIYELLRSEAYRKISGLPRDQIRLLREIGSITVRLMQAATNPMLLSSEDEYFNEFLDVSSSSSLWDSIFQYSKYEKPAKFEFLRTYTSEYLSKDQENKVIVWTYFIKNIKLLEQVLKEYNPTSIYGAIVTGSDEDLSTREGRIKQFHHDPNCRVLIANPQACGEGISLHKASHHAIYLDRNFNAAYYLQSVDRIHRLGLSKTSKTEITILESMDTIDNVIRKRLNTKTERMADVLNDKSLKKLALDPFDIRLDDSLGLDDLDVKEIVNHLSTSES